MNTTSLVKNVNRISYSKTMLRRDLKPGDLFKVKGGTKTYMATSKRTAPPSENNVTITVGDKKFTHQIHKVHGRTSNGKEIVGYQSIVVQGAVTCGEDGGVVTFNGDREVTVVGRSTVDLNLWK